MSYKMQHLLSNLAGNNLLFCTHPCSNCIWKFLKCFLFENRKATSHKVCVLHIPSTKKHHNAFQHSMYPINPYLYLQWAMQAIYKTSILFRFASNHTQPSWITWVKNFEDLGNLVLSSTQGFILLFSRTWLYTYTPFFWPEILHPIPYCNAHLHTEMIYLMDLASMCNRRSTGVPTGGGALSVSRDWASV